MLGYELIWVVGVLAIISGLVWVIIKIAPFLIKAAIYGAILAVICFVGFYAYNKSDVRVSDYKSLIN